MMCFAFLGLSCAFQNEKVRNDIPVLEVLDDTLSLENACKRISLSVLSRLEKNDSNGLTLFYGIIDKAADSLKRALGRNAQTLVGEQAILDVVYNNWKMGFDPRDDVIETILPHLAFKKKKGNCMGVSLMILILAEKLSCPIYGVVLPGHFFCRYDDGATRVNIEPNRRGFQHPDDYYRTKYLSSGFSMHTLTNLTKKETLGVLYYTVGTLFLKRHDNGFAAACLKESFRRVPLFIEAKGNYACALALCGKSDSAIKLFDSLFETYPSMINLAANYGAVAMEAGHYQKALQIYKKGLHYFPSDPKLLLGLSQAYVKCAMKDSVHAESFR